MRNETAKALEFLGFVIDRDFEAYQVSPGVVSVKWIADAPQPDEKAIDAAVIEMATAHQAEETKRVESDTARSEAKQAYSDLQPLIEHKDPAIALLASIMQKHLLATLGR